MPADLILQYSDFCSEMDFWRCNHVASEETLRGVCDMLAVKGTKF